MIRDDGWRQKTRKFESAMAIGCTHHCNFDALIAQASDTSSPLAFNHALSLKLEAQFAKELDHSPQVFNDDSYVVHALERHAFKSTTYRSFLTRAAANRGVPGTQSAGARAARCTGAWSGRPIGGAGDGLIDVHSAVRSF